MIPVTVITEITDYCCGEVMVLYKEKKTSW